MVPFPEALRELAIKKAQAHKLEADLAKLPVGVPERPGRKEELRIASTQVADLFASALAAGYQLLGEDPPAGAGPAPDELTDDNLDAWQAMMKPLVEVNSLRMRIDQQLAGPTSPEGWRARALFTVTLPVCWPELLLRRVGCPPYAASTHDHLVSAAIVLLGTFVYKLFLSGGDWPTSFRAAFFWLAGELFVARLTALHLALASDLQQREQDIKALSTCEDEMLKQRKELSAAGAPSLARLAAAAACALGCDRERAQQALGAAETGRLRLSRWR